MNTRSRRTACSFPLPRQVSPPRRTLLLCGKNVKLALRRSSGDARTERTRRDRRRIADLGEFERMELLEEQAEERRLEAFRWRAAGVIRVS